VLAPQHRARARHRDEEIAACGRLERRHHLEAVHARLERTHRVDLAHDHGRAGTAGSRGDALAGPAVADDHEGVAGEQHVGGAQDAVQRGLAGAVAVVECPLRDRLVDGEHGVGKPPRGVEAANANQPGGGLLDSADDAGRRTV